MRRGRDRISEVWPVRRQEVADSCRQPRLFGDLEDEPVGENGRAGRLPQTHVAHDGGRDAQVPANGGKIEGRDGSNEAFQPAPLDPIPHVRRVKVRLFLCKEGKNDFFAPGKISIFEQFCWLFSQLCKFFHVRVVLGYTNEWLIFLFVCLFVCLFVFGVYL